ncbi:MAG TPA: vanadium-dependent haloperoxidase, partial [Chitinophagales bacterium]|nr:vanadium-dependent haloperoxidase [Chitinophagales bacterium]
IYNWPMVANAAMAEASRLLFANTTPANFASIDSLEADKLLQYKNNFGIKNKTVNRSVLLGKAVAQAVYDWSLTDGGHEDYSNLFPTSYIPPVGAGMWVPTPPANSAAMLPYWGNNRTMLPANTAASFPAPAPPPAFSTTPGSPMYTAAMEVYNVSMSLTPAQTTIAQYWNDGGGTFTPPGHNMAIALQLVQIKNYKLDKAAKLLTQVAISQYDASIICWRCKFMHNLQRPITYIRENIPGADTWTSTIPTPPFPSYTSGHSTFSGASAKVLAATVGANFAFTDYSKVPFGFSPRSYPNVNAAAQEAAISRLYGGIHFAFDNNEGVTCGQILGQNVLNLNWQ